MVPLDLRRGVDDHHQPLRHDLLFAGRTARLPRDGGSHRAQCGHDRGASGAVKQEHADRVDVLSLYWHFVDAVWVVVFTVVYSSGGKHDNGVKRASNAFLMGAEGRGRTAGLSPARPAVAPYLVRQAC